MVRNIWDDKVLADREPHKIEIVIKKNKINPYSTFGSFHQYVDIKTLWNKNKY